MATFADFVQTSTEHNFRFEPATVPFEPGDTTVIGFDVFVRITATVESGLRGQSIEGNGGGEIPLTYILISDVAGSNEIFLNILPTPYTDTLFPTPSDPAVFNTTTGLAEFAVTTGEMGEFANSGYTSNEQIENANFTIEMRNAADEVLATSSVFNITSILPCFQKGTHILTPTGEKPVELLEKGDLVISAKTGKSVRIKSMLHFVGTQENCPLYCLPKNALGQNKPARDLFLSSRHRVLYGGKLRHMVCLADFIDPRIVEHDWKCTRTCCTYIPIGQQPATARRAKMNMKTLIFA
jgi:hypothetical protein